MFCILKPRRELSLAKSYPNISLSSFMVKTIERGDHDQVPTTRVKTCPLGEGGDRE